jgi:hypothetical protein
VPQKTWRPAEVLLSRSGMINQPLEFSNTTGTDRASAGPRLVHPEDPPGPGGRTAVWGSYFAVRRFVLRRVSFQELPFQRMECAAGQELQIDFGQGAWVTVLWARSSQRTARPAQRVVESQNLRAAR